MSITSGCRPLEFLDTQIPAHIDDLDVVGGHRRPHHGESGAPRAGIGPVDAGWFKNSTDGNVQAGHRRRAVAASERWFPGVTKQGVSAIFHTTGNDTCHVILRGGSRSGPNYEAAHVAEACARLADEGPAARR